MNTDEGDLGALLETGECLLKASQPLEALKVFYAGIKKQGYDAKFYEKAAFAFLATFLHLSPGNPSNIKPDVKFSEDELLEKLILQEECRNAPSHFLSVIAYYYSANYNTLPMVSRKLAPVLRKLCQQKKINKNLVLTLLYFRKWMTSFISQTEISRLHKEYFHKFSWEEMKLPYSFIFFPSLKKNRQDLIDIANDLKKNWAKTEGIELYQILFLAWVAPEAFDFLNGAEKIISLMEGQSHDRIIKDPENQKAGKTLLLRYIQGGTDSIRPFLNPLLESLSCSASYLPLLEETVKKRAMLMRGRHEPRLNFRKTLMRSRIYAGINILKNLIPARIYSGFSRKIKVAICVSGQPRGFQKAFLSWGDTLTKNIDYDIFVHTWKRVGRSEPLPWRPCYPWKDGEFTKAYKSSCSLLGFEEIKRRYVSFFQCFDYRGTVSVEDLVKVYNTKHVIVEDDADEKFRNFSNSDKMHYKIAACHQYMLNRGKDYDLYVRIRPDIAISLMGFDWRDLYRRCKAEPVIFADQRISSHFGALAMGDIFAVGGLGAMSLYSNTWNLYPVAASQGLLGWDEKFTGHGSLAQICWTYGINVEKIPIKWRGPIEANVLSLELILEKIEFDARNRGDDIDRRLIQALKRDLGSQ